MMDMLHRIRMEYDLENVTWIQENTLFQSERGKKRVRIWKDKQLLQWHVKWRDEMSKQSGILFDRMIRTKKGEPFFISDKGWVSIHDEIEECYPTEGKEREWGRLIGNILAYGLKQSEDCQRFRKQEPLTLTTARGTIEKLTLLDPMEKFVLERSFFEAKTRSRKAETLNKRVQEKKLPILPSFLALDGAKQIFNHLYWTLGDEQPIKGYESLRSFLEEWYEKHGEKSTEILFDRINDAYFLKGDQGLLLLSEFLLPYELQRTVSKIALFNQEEISETIDHYLNDWETTRAVVLLLSKWIEKDREKAVAK